MAIDFEGFMLLYAIFITIQVIEGLLLETRIQEDQTQGGVELYPGQAGYLWSSSRLLPWVQNDDGTMSAGRS